MVCEAKPTNVPSRPERCWPASLAHGGAGAQIRRTRSLHFDRAGSHPLHTLIGQPLLSCFGAQHTHTYASTVHFSFLSLDLSTRQTHVRTSRRCRIATAHCTATLTCPTCLAWHGVGATAQSQPSYTLDAHRLAHSDAVLTSPLTTPPHHTTLCHAMTCHLTPRPHDATHCTAATTQPISASRGEDPASSECHGSLKRDTTMERYTALLLS